MTTKATLRRPAGISTLAPATAAMATAVMPPVSQPAGRPRHADERAAGRADGKREAARAATRRLSITRRRARAISVGARRHRRAIQVASRSVASRICAGVASEAQAHEARAGRAEGGAGREADIGLVDQAQAEAAGVGFAVDREEQVEGAVRLGEAHAAGGGQAVADDVAAGAGALDLASEGSRRPRRARRTAARCMKAATPEVEYWTRFSIAWPSAGGADSQPIRQPVIAQFFEKVLT